MAAIVGADLVSERASRVGGTACLLGAAGLAMACVAWERRVSDPLLPAVALGRPNLRRGAAASWLNTATTSSAVTVAALYLQDARHRGPLAAAAALVPLSVTAVAGSAAAAPLLRRWSPTGVVASGLSLVAASVAGFVAATGLLALMPVCAAGIGLGLGASSVAATSLGTDVPAEWRSTASGVVNTAAQLGTALGTAALLVVATAAGGAGSGGAGPVVAWIVAAAVAVAGSAAFAFRRGEPHPPPEGAVVADRRRVRSPVS